MTRRDYCSELEVVAQRDATPGGRPRFDTSRKRP